MAADYISILATGCWHFIDRTAGRNHSRILPSPIPHAWLMGSLFLRREPVGAQHKYHAQQDILRGRPKLRRLRGIEPPRGWMFPVANFRNVPTKPFCPDRSAHRHGGTGAGTGYCVDRLDLSGASTADSAALVVIVCTLLQPFIDLTKPVEYEA